MSGVSAPAAAHALDVKKRAVAGASWTVAGYGAQQVLRFGSNLVLTRLLAPDAFGLMALTSVFVLGLELLSDVGVGPAIIASHRGDDRRLLDTAWTVQVIRGFLLFGLALGLALPVAGLYAEPRLAGLVAVAGAGIAIRGFTATRVHTLNRQVVLGRLTAMELLCHAVNVGVTIAAAWWLRTAWALLIGSVVADGVRVALSYLLLPGHRHRLLLDRHAVSEIVHVGRWILFSTAVTYAAGQLDRLTMGRLLSVREVGIYSIAFQMVTAVVNVGRTVGSRVLFPVLAETVRHAPERLYGRLKTARMPWVLPTTAGLLALAIWGDGVIGLLYPRDYQDAGWMLRLLAAGSVAAVVNQSTGVIWPALGEFRTITVLMLVQVPVLFGGMLLGHALYGLPGLVAAIAAVELVVYPFQAALIARRKLWQPELDLPVLAASALVVAAGALLR